MNKKGEMKITVKRITLWTSEEYHFPGAGKFIPFLVAHIHEDEEIHPAMMVVPGGIHSAVFGRSARCCRTVLSYGIQYVCLCIHK